MIQLSIHLEIILDSQIGALSNDPMIHSSGKDSRQSDSAPSISSSQIGLYLIIQLSSQIGLNLMIQSSIHHEIIIDSHIEVHLMIQ